MASTEKSGGASFWESTNRKRLTPESIRITHDSYAVNYSKYLPKSKDARILDLGCSEGIAIEWLADSGYENLIGVDSDPVAIDYARRRLSGKVKKDSLEVMNVLEFMKMQKDNSVDVVCAFNVVEHLSKSMLLEIMPVIKRKLKNEGILIAQTGNIENPLNYGLFARDFSHEVPFTSNSLRQLMRLSGFGEDNILISSLSYKITYRNFPLIITSRVFGCLLKGFAYLMRVRIDVTAPMIYCIAKK